MMTTFGSRLKWTGLLDLVSPDGGNCSAAVAFWKGATAHQQSTTPHRALTTLTYPFHLCHLAARALCHMQPRRCCVKLVSGPFRPKCLAPGECWSWKCLDCCPCRRPETAEKNTGIVGPCHRMMEERKLLVHSRLSCGSVSPLQTKNHQTPLQEQTKAASCRSVSRANNSTSNDLFGQKTTCKLLKTLKHVSELMKTFSEVVWHKASQCLCSLQ